MNYNYRYPLPSTPAMQAKGPKVFSAVTPMKKTANMYGSVEIAGVAKVIMVTSYIPQVRASVCGRTAPMLGKLLGAPRGITSHECTHICTHG